MDIAERVEVQMDGEWREMEEKSGRSLEAIGSDPDAVGGLR